MRLHADRHRYMRRKTEIDAWESTIDALAIQICPMEELEAYKTRVRQLEWTQQAPGKTRSLKPRVRVFPIWRKYRQNALRVITLYETIPVLQRLPLKLACILGDLFIK